MNCNRLREILPLYAGRDLDDPTARDVRQHLEICRSCRKISDSFGRQTALLRNYGEEIKCGQEAPDLWHSIRARLGTEVRDPLSPFYRPPGWC